MERKLFNIHPKQTKVDIDCIFCDILHHQKDKVLYEDTLLFIFLDKKRHLSKEHILVCPKEHIEDADRLTNAHIPLVTAMHKAALMQLSKIVINGEYRFGFHEPPINTVGHLHLHGIALPIPNEYMNDIVYGTMLTSPETLIECLKNRILKQKATNTSSIEALHKPTPKL